MNSNIRKLQYLPYGTKEYEKELRSIQKDIKSRDFILCMKGKFTPDRNVFADNNISLVDPATNGMSYKSVFPGDKTVFESKDYFFVRRDQAEYNLDYRQVNVGVIVVDNNNKILLLRKRNGYLSMVGGHTDFVKESYNMSVKELTYYNVVKEYNEEVITNLPSVEIPDEPLFFITEGREMWDFLHAWFVYVVTVEDIRDYKFKSGESDKHKTVIVDIDEAISDGKIKNSLRQALILYKEASSQPERKTTIKVNKPEQGMVTL